MLDKTIQYRPTLRTIGKLEIFDKLNDRYVENSDNLEALQPIILEPGKPKPDPYSAHPNLERFRS